MKVSLSRKFWFVLIGLFVALALGVGIWAYLDSRRLITLKVAAGKLGSDSYELMHEVAEILDRRSSTLRLEVMESINASNGITRIENGQIDLAVVSANTPAYTNVQLVTELFPDYLLLIAHAEQRWPEQKLINNLLDIPGRSIALPQAGRVGNLAFWSVIDHYRIPPQSFRSIPLPRQVAMEKFLSGHVDGIFFMRSLRDPYLLRFIEEAGLRNIALKFIPIDQASAMGLKRPYLNPGLIVKGAFDGRQPLPLNDIVVPTLKRLLVSAKTVSDRAIRELVETIFANRLNLMIRMPLSTNIQDPREEGKAILKLHEGAAQYYDRNEPSFLQENSESMAFIITFLAMTVSAFLGLRRTFQARAKNRADVYNDQLLAIAAQARDSTDIAQLQSMRGRLGEIMELVVHALDADQVTKDDFRSFAQVLDYVRETINDRIQELS